MGAAHKVSAGPLRVALVAGGLSQGGAEKQLVLTARSLRAAGAQVRIYSLTRGEFYQPILEQDGFDVYWIGRQPDPLRRLAAMRRAMAPFHPHIIQSTHFFANLYPAMIAPLLGAISIGSVRSSGRREVKANGAWGPLLLKLPQAIIANSEAARPALIELGRRADSLFILPNGIDLAEFDRLSLAPAAVEPPVTVITAARLVPVKRLDRFLAALALARKTNPAITAAVAGDGPEEDRLLALAGHEGLLTGGASFLGARGDIPALLARANIFILTSEQEGFPNAVLEAMAARLPVITTPAGDAPFIVSDGVTGFVVPHEDAAAMAEKILILAGDGALREKMGAAGRRRVESQYSSASFGPRLLAVYASAAARCSHQSTLRALSAVTPPG